MQSMTGYGTGSSAAANFTVKTELQSYNHRFLDVKVKLPNEYQSLESQVRKVIESRLSRGRVNVFIGFQLSGDLSQVIINEALARKYWNALNRLQRKLKVKNEIGAEALIRLPGVMEASSGLPSFNQFKKQVVLSLEQAVENLISMRKKEGRRLAADLGRHLRTFADCLKKIRNRQEEKPVPPPGRKGGRPSQEVPAPPPGANVQEELARLDSHIELFSEYLASDQPVGKTLEFLCQEMLREVTTLGDKAADSAVSRQIVIMKSAMESLREQTRNAE
ncbi:MAG: DUF1732 domain-containing protein [PVC group bacterium]